MMSLGILLALVAVGVLLVLAVHVRVHRCKRQQYDARDAQLNHAWRAMQAVNRINAAYWRAHEAMRRESERDGRSGIPPHPGPGHDRSRAASGSPDPAHATVRQLRESHLSQPWAWTALVHAGA
jgi:hypothetical protein